MGSKAKKVIAFRNRSFVLLHPFIFLVNNSLFKGLVNFFSTIISAIAYKISSIHVWWRVYSVVKAVKMVPTLNGIGMNYAKLFVKNNSSTSFFSFLFIPISSFHVFSWKNALLKLEIDAIIRKCTREDLAFYLFNKLVYCITKCEVSLQCWVGMKVNIHKKTLFLRIVLPELLDGPAGRLGLWVRSSIVPIQILVEDVHSAVATRYSIRIQHWYQDEHKVFP